MKYYLFTYSKSGIETAKRVAHALSGEICLYTVERLSESDFLPIPSPSAPLYEKAFATADALIFVSSCGIAVRSIAPYIRSKTTDPAVIVINDGGGFVIPVLSGHIGGANALASVIAQSLSATAVITTATDVHGRFRVDEWAARRGFVISDMSAAKAVSAAILENDVPLVCDFPMHCELPCGVVSGSTGDIGISITYKTCEPFKATLRIIPKCLYLGIGCRRGTPKEAIRIAVETVMAENGLEMRAIRRAASIKLKADEAGLLEFCREADIPIDFYSAEELSGVAGDFTPSKFVKSITGVDNVCERAAMLSADRLLIKKTPVSGITVAVGIRNTEVSF